MRQIFQDEYGQAYEKIECPRCGVDIKIEKIPPFNSKNCLIDKTNMIHKLICQSCLIKFCPDLSRGMFDAPSGYKQYHEPRPRLGIDVAKD